MSEAVKIADGILFLYPSGELDDYQSRILVKCSTEAFEQGRVLHVVIDFSKVEFMDSSGIGLVMGRVKEARICGGRVILLSPKPSILRLFEMSGMLGMVEISENEEQAVIRLLGNRLKG